MDAVAALRDVYTKVLVAHCIRIKRRKGICLADGKNKI